MRESYCYWTSIPSTSTDHRWHPLERSRLSTHSHLRIIENPHHDWSNNFPLSTSRKARRSEDGGVTAPTTLV